MTTSGKKTIKSIDIWNNISKVRYAWGINFDEIMPIYYNEFDEADINGIYNEFGEEIKSKKNKPKDIYVNPKTGKGIINPKNGNALTVAEFEAMQLELVPLVSVQDLERDAIFLK